MTVVSDTAPGTMGVIQIEILRHRLQALTDEAARIIERTAVSPVVVESGDYSTAILDGRGDLVVGGGKISMQFNEATNAVRGVLAARTDIAAGDVFLSNDPHGSGGLHPQDVIVLRPVFSGGELAAWLVNSAHLMDLGGMVPGSFSPNATECYQEGLRIPPVHLVRAGAEQVEVWSILLNNVRMSGLVEMDLRALMAGVNVGHDRLVPLLEETGLERFRFAVGELNRRTEIAVRGRIGELAEGTYSYTTYAEWKGEFYRIPCSLRVENSFLTFDFEGAAPQVANFVNSKGHVVKSMLSMYMSYYLLGDLPHNQGYLDSFDVLCPEGSVVNSRPPAPVGAAHLIACMDAVSAALRCLLAAAAASPGSYVSQFLSAVPAHAEQTLLILAGQSESTEPFVWMMGDSFQRGAPAAAERDGTDFYWEMVGSTTLFEQADVESTESWYPVRFRHRRRDNRVAHGALRGGAGAEVVWEPTGSASLFGTSIGEHDLLPSAGSAGGLDAPRVRLAIGHEDGTESLLSLATQGFEVKAGEEFRCLTGSGAAWGDPLARNAAKVEADVREGLVTEQEALEIYGVVIGDPAATPAARARVGSGRLARAQPPMEVPEDGGGDAAPGTVGAPLAPGVEQRGSVAVAVESGALLALAPRHWTDGCPVLVEAMGLYERRGYLDPVSGRLLHVEVVPAGERRSFESMPSRWRAAVA